MKDLSRIMSLYKQWHLDFAPKCEFTYFLQRISQMGTKKEMLAHRKKLEHVYKGEEPVFWQPAVVEESTEAGQQVEAQKEAMKPAMADWNIQDAQKQ